SASVRYMAPVSIFTYPYFRANRAATVLFPDPAGPSMAITTRRARCAFATGLSALSLSMHVPSRLEDRSKAQHSSCAGVHPAQLARRQQRVDCFAHFGARRHAREQLFDVLLAHRDGSFQILADQRGNGFRSRDVDSLFHRFRRPAIKDVPERAFARAIVNTRDLQDRPQLSERSIQSGA